MKLSRKVKNRFFAELNQYRLFDFQTSIKPICLCSSRHELIFKPLSRDVVVLFSKGTIDLASVQMRLIQVAKFIQSQSFNIKFLALSLRPSNIIGLKNSIVVLSKFAAESISRSDLLALYKNNNSIFVDPVDLNLELSKFAIDCTLVASSFQQATHFKTLTKLPVELIYHSSDLRLKDIKAQQNTFSIGYFGNLARIPSDYYQLDLLKVIKTPLSFESSRALPRYSSELKNYSAHLVTGTTSPKNVFKPFTKGIVAAHVGAVSLLSVNDSEGITLLGKNYPYIAQSNTTNSIKETIDFMHKSFMSEHWGMALKLNRNLESYYCQVNVTNMWLRLLS